MIRIVAASCPHGYQWDSLCKECKEYSKRYDREGIREGKLIYAVVPWRGDGKYSIDQAVKQFKVKPAAEKYAEKLNAAGEGGPHGYVVRTLRPKVQSTLERVLADQDSGNPLGQGNMQVHEPTEEKNAPALLPDVGVPSAPFQPREALLIRPHYLGREIRYPFVDFYTGQTTNQPEVKPVESPESPVDPSLVPPIIEPVNQPDFENYPQVANVMAECKDLYSIDQLKKDLTGQIQKGLTDDGDYLSCRLVEFSPWEIVDICSPGEFYAHDEGVSYKVVVGPEEVTQTDDGQALEKQAAEDFKECFTRLSKEVGGEMGVGLDWEKNKDKYEIFCVIEKSDLPFVKDKLGIVQAELPPTEMDLEEPAEAQNDEVERQANMEKLKIESPEEFGIKYKGELRQLAEERGLGDLLGYVFRTRKIDLIGTDKVLHLDYDMNPIHALDVYPVEEV
jgi:hypothetical protein